MTNANAVDASKIEIGDRVEVTNADKGMGGLHWGTVIAFHSTDGVYAMMDDAKLYNAKAFGGYDDIPKSYWASLGEIEQHIPANKVAMHEGRPVNVEDHGHPKTLTVHDDIQATLDYLHSTTKRKWKATTKDVCLEVDGTTTYAGSMTISFREDK